MRDTQEDKKALSEDLFCIRGLSILLVVLFHVLGVDSVHGVRKLFAPDLLELRIVAQFIHSFNMAVMMIGSGVAVAAFGQRELSLSDFGHKKLSKLVVPMLVWSPVLLVVQSLSSEAPHSLKGWLVLLSSVPFAWFPPYSIFWFVHALVGCTLLAWLFRRFFAARLGGWSGLVWLGVAILLHFGVKAWKVRSGGESSQYLELILYWNRFFALGLFIHPWLGPARQRLARLPVVLLGLLPMGLFALITFIFRAYPAHRYEEARVLNGPLGFGLLFSLSLLLQRGAGASLWREARARLIRTGTLSMTLYLFHVFFVSGTRIALERLHPGTPLAVHLVLGCLAGVGGPWLLFLALKGRPLFLWSIGLAVTPTPREDAPGAPRLGAV